MLLITLIIVIHASFNFADGGVLEKFLEIPFSSSDSCSNYYLSKGHYNENEPLSFAIDSKNNVYLVDDKAHKIKVFHKNEFIREFSVPQSARKLIVCNERNSIFVQIVHQSILVEYSLDGTPIDTVSYSANKRQCLDFKIDSGFVFFIYWQHEYGGSSKYIFRRINLTNGEDFSKQLSIDVNQPMMFQQLFHIKNNHLFIPSAKNIYKSNFEGNIVETYPNKNIAGFGVIHIYNDFGLLSSIEGSPRIKYLNLKFGIFKEINLVEQLEALFDGEFGSDFMYGDGGFVYNTKYYNGYIYVLGSSKEKLMIFRMKA